MNKLIQSLSALGVSATLVTPNLNAQATSNTNLNYEALTTLLLKR